MQSSAIYLTNNGLQMLNVAHTLAVTTGAHASVSQLLGKAD